MPRNGAKISLSSHSIRVRERRGLEPLGFGLFDGHRDLIDEVYLFLSALMDTHTNDLISRSVLKTQILERDDDSVWGIIQAGPYGYGGEIVDTETFDTAHPLSPREAVLQPFYFLINVPNHASTGVLILHRSGGKGIQTQFVSYLRQFFADRNREHLLDVDPQVPGAVLQHLFEGEIRRINPRSCTGGAIQLISPGASPSAAAERLAEAGRRALWMRYSLLERRNFLRWTEPHHDRDAPVRSCSPAGLRERGSGRQRRPRADAA